MAYNRNQAKTLCTKAEYDLFESSMKGSIEQLPQKRVQDGIKRARTLRDKYRDLHQRQRLTTRDRTGTKKGVKPATNERTEDKVKLFTEVLGRFEDRLKLLKQDEKAAVASKKAAATKPTQEKPAKKNTAAKKTASKKTAAKKTTSKKVTEKKAAPKKASKKTAAKKKVSKKLAKKTAAKQR